MRAVAPQAQASVLAVHNAANWQTNVSGTTSQFFTAQQWALTGGRIWTDAEEQSGKAVCVIGNHRPAESVPATRIRSASVSASRTCPAR